MVLDTDDYSRILQRAQLLSVQERKEAEAQQKAHANDRMEASNARKREMQELEFSRRKNEKPSDLEQVSHASCDAGCMVWGVKRWGGMWT